VLEVILASRLAWWKVPRSTLGFWGVAMFLVCLPLAGWLLQGKRWAHVLSSVLSGLWVLASLGVAIYKRNPSVGFFTLFLGLFLLLLMNWIQDELNRSYFNPRLSWYQGLPKPVAGLHCEVSDKGLNPTEYFVSRMDEEGAFLFVPKERGATLAAGQMFDLSFRHGHRKFACRGVPMRELGPGLGSGFQFRELTPDLRKDLGDFVEALRGEGYVS
jgi:hypothetical protein